MVGDSALAKVTHIVVDDIQERNCFTDLLLLALRDSVSKFPLLRLIFISATGDIHMFANYFNNCPVFCGSVYMLCLLLYILCQNSFIYFSIILPQHIFDMWLHLRHIFIIIISSSAIILVIPFMQGIYNYIPEINCFSRVCSVAAVLYLQFVLHVMSFRLWNMFCTFIFALSVVCVRCYISTLRGTCAVYNMAVFCGSWILCFPGMLLGYCLNDFIMVPVAPVITSITFVFTFLMHWISFMRSLYFKICLVSWLHFCLQELQNLLTCMFLVNL